MHEIYRTLADDIHRDRLLEAEHSRLARQVPRHKRRTLAARLRGRFAALLGQPTPAPTLSTDPAARCS